MTAVEIKGLAKLKTKIHKLSNKMLIYEWQNTFLINSLYQSFDQIQCINCNLKKCIDFLKLEELITVELNKRVLYYYAINRFYPSINQLIITSNYLKNFNCYFNQFL